MGPGLNAVLNDHIRDVCTIQIKCRCQAARDKYAKFIKLTGDDSVH